MRKKDPEKFLRLWEKERKGGKEKYVAYRTVVMGLAIVAGSMVERALSGDPFFLDISMFFAGAVGGAIGSLIAWKRSEEKFQGLREEQDTWE